MSECRSCQAEVIFVPSATTGRSMILDAKPARGVIIRCNAHHATPCIDGSHPGANAMVVDVYTDHHATCPKAKDWQGRTRKDPPTR